MTHAPPSPNPLGDAAATTDQVGLAARAMLAGILVGLAAFAVVVALVRHYAEASGVTDVAKLTTDAPQFIALQVGLPLGLVLAGGTAFWLMAPITQPWRRGGLAMVTALAGFVVAMLATFLAHQLGGMTALVALVPVGLLGAARAGLAARRAA
ncbi:MAG TPA: hypothetical protein VFN90_01865 [Gemmatimonadales bacterium]|nr:hypothetical protein [Gemmatimonadales bacterium]